MSPSLNIHNVVLGVLFRHQNKPIHDKKKEKEKKRKKKIKFLLTEKKIRIYFHFHPFQKSYVVLFVSLSV